MKVLLFERKGSFLIQLYQTGKDKYRVNYGAESWKGDYEYASRKLGEAIMHDLNCAGAWGDPPEDPVVTASDMITVLRKLASKAHGGDTDLSFVSGKAGFMVQRVYWNELGDSIIVRLKPMD